jgi:hypothetical protein
MKRGIANQASEAAAMLTATVSGSFHRFMPEVESAVHELAVRGVCVLSPAYPKVVDHIGEFLFVASDRVRSIRLVQDRHLDSIEGSDFLWLVCPGGYVGQSASMELGFAVANDVPVFSTDLPADLTLRQYVRKTESLAHAIRLVGERTQRRPEAFLINPHASIEAAHRVLERIDRALQRPAHLIDHHVGCQVNADRALVGSLIDSRTEMHIK